MGATASLKRGIGSAVKAAAAGVDVVRPGEPGLVVLIYHRIGGWTSSQVDLATGRFDEQVAELAEAGRLVSLDHGLSRLMAGDLHDRPVVLSFDDGTADWVDEVLPVLSRYRAPATFYVATDFVERGLSFPGGAAPISWAGLGELLSSGLATVGSHTHTHALLDRADGPTAASELDRSIELIGEQLGVACEHFAYPKALLGAPPAEGEVRQRFRSATLAGSRANPAGADLHRLHRTPIQVADGMRWFRRKAAGGMRLEDTARSVLNRRRYAGATT
ncbi:MAG: polysaccharide deacetylase family protein [Acidimicrobiales bacterium]